MQPVYDVQCSRCRKQLNFVEVKDGEGDGLILVDPCPDCSAEPAEEDISGARVGEA